MATLERAGIVTGVITQNVDLLHTKAGSRNVIICAAPMRR